MDNRQKVIVMFGLAALFAWFRKRPTPVPPARFSPIQPIDTSAFPQKRYVVPQIAPTVEIRTGVQDTQSGAVWVTPEAGRKYQFVFDQAEVMHGIPPGVLSRMAAKESGYNPNAKSPAGAIGLMQIIPRWHPTVDARDPIASIYYAGKYMRQNYDRFGTWAKALAAYNWGPTALASAIKARGDDWRSALPRETIDYISTITRDTGLRG